MSAHHNKKSLKQVLTLIGVASASTLLALPAFAQFDSGNTQQNPLGTGGTPETLGSPISPPQVPPVGTGTVPQSLGSPISPPQVPPVGNGTVPQSLEVLFLLQGRVRLSKIPRGRAQFFNFLMVRTRLNRILKLMECKVAGYV